MFAIRVVVIGHPWNATTTGVGWSRVDAGGRCRWYVRLPLRVAIVPGVSDPAGADGDAALGAEVVAGLWAGSEIATDTEGTTDAG